jgi:nucleotide-binding universal stress UspA family protein
MTRIVVGVDESEPAREALRWAVAEGQRRNWPVRAVLAWSFVDQHDDQHPATFRPDYGQHDAEAVLDRLVAATVPGADVECVAVCDLPARALLEAAAGAGLLVVGARGIGGVQGMVLGSVSQQVVRHAPVPTAIARPQPAVAEHVVVGVDGSANSMLALRWALDAARARQARVTVIHGMKRSPFAAGKQPRAGGEPGLAATALGEVDASGLTVEAVASDDNPGKALVAASRDATLVVVGSRGRGGFAALMLGSVGQHVASHAACPVVVVPPADRGER